MVCIFRKYEDDVARYYRERKKRELEKSKLFVEEYEDVERKPESDNGERSITDYIRIEDCYESSEDGTLEKDKNSRISGCLLYFLLFVFLAMAIFGFGGMLISSLRGEKEVFHQEDENTFETNAKGYEFLSRAVGDVCKVVSQDGRIYLITSDRYNEYLPMISGCIDISEDDGEIDIYQDGTKNYIKYRYRGFVVYVEYYVKEFEGRYYMELYSESGQRAEMFNNSISEEVIRESLKGYEELFSQETE